MASLKFEDNLVYTDASPQNSEEYAQEGQPEEAVIHYDHPPDKHHYLIQNENHPSTQVHEQKEKPQIKIYHKHKASKFHRSIQKRRARLSNNYHQRRDKFLIDENTITIPRLNVDLLVALPIYKDKIITIVGKYISTNNSNTISIFIDATKQYFHVKHSSQHKGYDTNFIQITGYFLGGNSEVIPMIKQTTFENWGDNFNLLLWNKLLLLIPKYPNLF